MAATTSSTTRRLPPPPPPQGPDHPYCPRCDSRDTKFCYYNNYNLAQPRYFCKSCRRYWTLGGTLRNIPVGGTTRKSSATAAASASPTNYASKRRRTKPIPTSSSSSTSNSTPSSPSTVRPPSTNATAPEEPNMSADVVGTFGQLLMEPLPLLREPFLGSRLGFGLGLGLGLGGMEEMGFGLGRAGWSFLGGDDGGLMVGADAWHVPGGGDILSGGDAGGDGPCMAWPDLSISSKRIQ